MDRLMSLLGNSLIGHCHYPSHYQWHSIRLEWYCSWIYKMIFDPVRLTSQLLSFMMMAQVQVSNHLCFSHHSGEHFIETKNFTKSYMSVIIFQKQNGCQYLKYCLCPVPISSQHHWKAYWCLLISRKIPLQYWNTVFNSIITAQIMGAVL